MMGASVTVPSGSFGAFHHGPRLDLVDLQLRAVSGSLSHQFFDDHLVRRAEDLVREYILHDGVWEPLVDGWYLMDMVIDGAPDLTARWGTRPRESQVCNDGEILLDPSRLLDISVVSTLHGEPR